MKGTILPNLNCHVALMHQVKFLTFENEYQSHMTTKLSRWVLHLVLYGPKQTVETHPRSNSGPLLSVLVPESIITNEAKYKNKCVSGNKAENFR